MRHSVRKCQDKQEDRLGGLSRGLSRGNEKVMGKVLSQKRKRQVWLLSVQDYSCVRASSMKHEWSTKSSRDHRHLQGKTATHQQTQKHLTGRWRNISLDENAKESLVLIISSCDLWNWDSLVRHTNQREREREREFHDFLSEKLRSLLQSNGKCYFSWIVCESLLWESSMTGNNGNQLGLPSSSFWVTLHSRVNAS